MYTQCPECGIAFRVTADVLKVAAGKVRCGGCAHAFNALDYLSEEMPEQAPPSSEAEPQLPELTPEPLKAEGTLPESISAEQSAALLKTLDELAGSDIRIEDTGVEWMVLDEDDADEPESVDEVLEESPTPVDEFLTKTPEVVDSTEIFDEAANAPAQTPVEELRFDDNTPLPDDFEFPEVEAQSEPEPEPEPEPDPEPPHPDIALSDPHEWTDILDEFEELVEEVAPPVDEELALEVESLDDEEPLDVEEPVEEVLAEDDEPLEDMFAEEDEPAEIDEPLEDMFAEEDSLELEAVDDDPQLDLIEEPLIEEPIVEAHDIEAELAMADDEPVDEIAEEVEPGGNDHYVPPMSEEEQTVNMQIDQELFAIAVEDDDGFASTIIIPEEMTPEKALEADTGDDQESDDETDAEVEDRAAQTDTGFETIIMEGAEITSALDDEKRAADVAEAAELQAIAKAAESDAANKAGSKRYGMIAALVALVILLVVQIVHQSREALATIPAFNDTVGPIYRALGKPLQPAWDITGWRIEATSGEIGDESEDLNVYSRIGNNSSDALPYPLILISLSDRYLDSLGSHVLNPSDYLGSDTDPSKLVKPGDSFEALIKVATPPLEASSYEVDVCYRLAEGQLRCKDENFK